MCIILNAMIFLCFGREELCVLLADVEVYKHFTTFLDNLPAEKVKPYWLLTCKNYKRFLQTGMSHIHRITPKNSLCESTNIS